MQNFGQPFMNPNMQNNFNNMNNVNINMQNNLNNFNNMNIQNNFNNFGFQNQNMNQMMPQNLVAGNWFNMYTSNQPDFSKKNVDNNGKITVVFKTGRGVITTIYIDRGKTVSYLLQVYFKRVGKPELFNRPLEIGFIFNARVIKFNESKLVEDFFRGVDYATITVNDIGDLIGA